MRFSPTDEQRDFAGSLDRLLAGADVVAAARAWAEGDPAPGRTLWTRLAEQGVTALLVPEEDGGLEASPVELVLAMEVLGRHGVPGPWVESAAYLATLLRRAPRRAVAEGAMATVAVPPHVPYGADAEYADSCYLQTPGACRAAVPAEPRQSMDSTRRIAELAAVEEADPVEIGDPAAAFDLAVLASAAQLLGAGRRLLDDSVSYVAQRRQFGRPIGSYQAIKHRMADVRIALDFAEPLVRGAALTDDAHRARDVSAAKVAATDAAYLAARTALQVHGAVGYTRELDLSLWVTRVRALHGTWGTPVFHRGRVLTSLLAERESTGAR